MSKILVVDDEPTYQKLLGELIRRAGYEVVIARDGLEAKVALEEHGPDLMVLDVMMPGMSGYEVAHSVKQDKKFVDLPILLLTARGRELDSRLSEAMGIEYLHKSCSPQELLEKIDVMLTPAEE
ncbi:MAG: response regulator [Candidatus Omnitrophica bacterium]|nr:response regulator [Candidatus Omnitrophota bacterium]